MPPYRVRSGPTTVEILISTTTPGWEIVPLVSNNKSANEVTGVDIACEDVASGGSSGEAAAGHTALLS